MTELRDLDYSGLLGHGDEIARRWEREIRDRALARVAKFVPITVDDRFESFRRLGYRPHGLYVPSADYDELRADLQRRVADIGVLGRDAATVDEMLVRYQALQDETIQWQSWGIAGTWTGQQAVARSTARFRIVAWGRRGGKTYHAAREALGVALVRPRSLVWMCAPTSKLVSRGFDMVMALLRDLNIPLTVARNAKDEKLVELENGSRIEGMSLENVWSAAGAAVDFAVIDEAAQLYPDAWFRGVHPTLMDRQGTALMISSWESEEDFFAQQAKRAKEREDPDWELFVGESWQNFFAFPEGRRSPQVIQAEREMPPKDFLEQYGAIPQNLGTLIYPQFKESVHVVDAIPHVGDWYDLSHPVTLAVDPTGGANEYGVVAIQDYGDESFVIDEYYVQGALTEEVTKVLDARPWRALVGDVVLDSASPAEIARWVNCGYTGAFGVGMPGPDSVPTWQGGGKPQLEVSIPVYRRLLRDPARFRRLYLNKVAEKCQELGIDLDDFDELPVDVQHRVTLEIEEDLTERPDRPLAQADLTYLKQCAHIFILRHCVATIDEHRHYAYPRKKRMDSNVQEHPRKWKDHLMDALRYWAWTYKRIDAIEDDDRVTSTIRTYSTVAEVPLTREERTKLARGEKLEPEPMPHLGFLHAMRVAHSREPGRVVSYVREY